MRIGERGPARGERTGTMARATCGEAVGFRVRSAAATRARKRTCLLVTALAAAALTGLIFVAIHLETVYPQGIPPAEELGTLVGLALAALVLVGCLIALSGDDGVTHDRKRGQGGHTFRPLNLLLAWRQPDGRDAPPNPEITFDS